MSTGPSRYAVAGQPVAHSQSPFIHAEFARQTGQALSYERLACPLDAFAATVRAFAASGAQGCNVTLPFKPQACGLAARLTPRAQLAGACNTLRFDAGGWLGDNTDGAGLVRDIAIGAGFDLRGARVLVLGAGGAAAGVLGPLLASGAAEVALANRTPGRAEALAARHRSASGEAVGAIDAGVDAVADGRVAKLSVLATEGGGEAFDLIVNATSSSVAGAPPPVGAHTLRRGGLAIDLMYGKPAAPFIAWAEAQGGSGRDGLGMLVEQAAESFQVWRGVRPETVAVLAALRERLRAAPT